MPDPGHHCLTKLFGPHLLLGNPLAENVIGVHPVLDRFEPGVVHLFGHVCLTDVDQHLNRPQEEPGGIRQILPSPARRRPMDRLKHRASIPDVGRAGETHRSRNLRRHVGKNVPVQVRHHDHIKHLGRIGQFGRTDIHDPMLLLDVRVFGPDLVKYLMKKPVGHLHDIVLGEAGHFLAAVSPRIFEGVAHDLLATGTGN